MPSITVKHQSLELNWPTPYQINEPKTLVLGSFNPYNGHHNSVDYYYGRKSNHFWRTIANILGQHEEYFFDRQHNLDRKLDVMSERFCCLDVIDYIDFISDDNLLLNNYLTNKIFANYLDQNIWTTSTNFQNKGHIRLTRKYNQKIISILKETQSIKKVIHTMGNNRIRNSDVNPKEKKLDKLGFGGFIDSVREICQEKKIDFIVESYSPSDYAIKNGNTSRETLRSFYQEHLFV